MLRTFLAAAALTLTATSAQAECHRVFFEPGTYGTSIQMSSYHALNDCFVLDVRPGQTARVRLAEGADSAFDIPGIGSDIQDVTFLLTTDRLEIYISKNSPLPLHFEMVSLEIAVW